MAFLISDYLSTFAQTLDASTSGSPFKLADTLDWLRTSDKLPDFSGEPLERASRIHWHWASSHLEDL
jgi:hypothetical protein